MAERKKLTDILNGFAGDGFQKQWHDTKAAQDFAPLPRGEYTCRVLSGELFTSKARTPGYKLTLQVVDGDHAGRFAWHDLWLTPAALPMTKRDLAKLAIDTPEKLEAPLPAGILVKVRLAVRQDDSGAEVNRVTRLEFAGIESGDAFAPASEPKGMTTGGPTP